jgi:hypothetical protein
MTIMSTIYSRLSYGTGTTLTGCGVSAKAYVETAKTAKEVSWMLGLPENVVSVAPEGDMLNWTGHNGFMMQRRKKHFFRDRLRRKKQTC